MSVTNDQTWVYLGDGVYGRKASYPPGTILICTSNGVDDSDMIVIEPEVLAAMNKLAASAREG